MKVKVINSVSRYTEKDIFKYLISIYGDRFEKYRTEWQLSSEGKYLPNFPLCLNYELIDNCNLRCIHCARQVQKSNRGRLGIEIFKKTIDEGERFFLPSIKIGFGEPFLERQIFDMIDYASNHGVMDIIVTTNGTLFGEEEIDKLLNSKITFLRISIDAASEEGYAKVRGGDLSAIEGMVKRLLTKRAERKQQLPLIRLSFVVTQENKHETELFIDKWANIVDFIDFQNYIEPPMPMLENHTDIEPVCSNFFCSYPWQMMAIMGDGDIRACCSWYGERLILGNLKSGTIKEAWESKSMNILRGQIRANTYTGYCAICVTSR
ncbi:MAG: radical SAM protein [Nitrospirae bacterium]|nr:radical SAM protein [Nitrospirota bacterium]